MTKQIQFLSDFGDEVVREMQQAFKDAPIDQRKQAVMQVVALREPQLTESLFKVFGGKMTNGGNKITREDCRDMAVQSVIAAFGNTIVKGEVK